MLEYFYSDLKILEVINFQLTLALAVTAQSEAFLTDAFVRSDRIDTFAISAGFGVIRALINICLERSRKEAEYFYYFHVINETIRDFSLFTKTSSGARTEAFMAITRRFRRVVAFDAQLLAFFRLASVTLLHRSLFRSRFNLLARWPLTEPATIPANQIFVFDERFSLRFFRQFEAIATMIFRFEEASLDAQQFVSGDDRKCYRNVAQLFVLFNLPNVFDLGIGNSRR